jgi:hypothetical protein
MELIDCIERRPVFITFGKAGGDTATFSVLRDAGTTTARLPADRPGCPADPCRNGRAGYPLAGSNSITGAAPPTGTAGKNTGLTGWTGCNSDSANDVTRASAVPAVAVS